MARPTVILPGYLAAAAPYREMEQALAGLGYPSYTVPLSRWDWLPTVGGRSVSPILARLDETVQMALAESGCDQVNLVGHSAGGWIARIYLGKVPYDVHPSDRQRRQRWAARDRVANLITLGTPHVSRERWTRRNLDFVNDNYPGAFEPTVNYVCVAGKAVYGRPSWSGWFTYNSYVLTGGRGDCWGDGITPIDAAHLTGAKNLVLDQVYHSPRPGYRWYGTPEVVAQWADYPG
ncbi:lipase [filamentous cyanobacterium CCP5]|nr:lipase [filamentous cyanobacterium CCP5]